LLKLFPRGRLRAIGPHLHESFAGLALHELPHAQVLALANRLRISAYDALYLGVSIELGVPLVTEDRRLREAAPDRSLSLTQVAAGE
jgi:predicted nucleic acid-binding protein